MPFLVHLQSQKQYIKYETYAKLPRFHSLYTSPCSRGCNVIMGTTTQDLKHYITSNLPQFMICHVVIRPCSCEIQLSLDSIILMNFKMPTTVGILTLF